jgi:two-component system, OmpR family, heavy metal sensor histidine kinase CusS
MAEAGDGDKAARELREKKRVLAALVVHDLRSPLSAIQGYLDLVREELGDDDAGHKRALGYIADAETLVGKALGLVATILDVDELEDGILRAQPQPTRIGELIERARAGNRAHFEVRQLRFEVSCDPEMLVRLDRDLFGRVLENLLDNASRYAPRGGRCAVAVTRSPAGLASRDSLPASSAAEGRRGSIEIAVGNDGPPVPAGDRTAIFGRYFQVEARRAAARANRGLGLYFCKLAVEAHGGTIHVEQRGELGAVFVVHIPE